MLSDDWTDFLNSLSLETLITVLHELRQEYARRQDIIRFDTIQEIRGILAERQIGPMPQPKRHYKEVLLDDAAAHDNLRPIGFIDYVHAMRQPIGRENITAFVGSLDDLLDCLNLSQD